MFALFSLLSRAIGGVGVSAVYIAGFSIIASDYEKDREKYISTFEVFSGLGLMLGPAFGSITYSLLGFSGMFIASALLLLIPVPSALHSIKNKIVSNEVEENFNFWGLLKKRNILLDCAVGLYANTVFNFFDPSLAPFLRNEGYDEIEIGYVFIVSLFAYTVGSFGLVFLLNRLNKFNLMVISIVTTIVGLFMIGPWEA